MTDFDLLVMSLGLNVCFIAYMYTLRLRIAFLVHTLRNAKFIVDCLADGKATASRGRDGTLVFKGVNNETDRHSIQAD